MADLAVREPRWRISHFDSLRLQGSSGEWREVSLSAREVSMLKLQLVTCHGPFLTPLLHIHWLQSSGGHLGSKHWMTELKAECCVPQDGRRKAAQPPVALARSRLSLFDFVCTHQLQMGQWISPSGFFLM